MGEDGERGSEQSSHGEGLTLVAADLSEAGYYRSLP